MVVERNIRNVVEKMYGRKIMANETVHHINSNTIDNSPDNLCLMTRGEHKKCHYSLQNCVMELFKNSIIGFDKGKYYIRL